MALRIFLLLLLAFPAFANEGLDDPQLEARAQALGAQVRCLVCQAQSVEDSQASLARDLRRFIRQEISSGASDDTIRDKLRATYGDRILLKPPVTGETALLWAAPLLLLLIALLLARKMIRPRK